VPSLKGTFRSLRTFNYRVWALGGIVSNVGTWMQRIAQDWIVLTQLSHGSATAVGIVTGLQFGPQVLLLPLTGYAADHLDRRRLLLATQALMGVLALSLGALTISGVLLLWHVYVFAFLLGCITAFDGPARNTFVSELVSEEDLSNAVALNVTSFHLARLLGPAVAGLVIAGVGSGWAFVVNGLSFAAVLVSLSRLRLGELRVGDRAERKPGGLAAGFRYVWGRPDLKVVFLMFFLIGTFSLNFPIFIATMSVREFHVAASDYGLLSSMAAIGSVVGALMAARRERPDIRYLFAGAAALGVGFGVAAVMPSYWLFGLALGAVGVATQTFTATSNGTVLAMALGGMALGSPFLGWLADHFGPRWTLYAASISGLVAANAGLVFLMKYRDPQPFPGPLATNAQTAGE
jgi:MFS family permease